MPINFITGQTYSFRVYPSTAITVDYDNCVVLGVIAYSIALNYGDIDALQIQALPSLPEGTPQDHTAYEYLLVRTSNGQQSVVARQWINDTTIVAKTNSNVLIKVHGASSRDVDEIRTALHSNGYTDLTISVIS